MLCVCSLQIVFLGKIMDELFLKVVEVRKIQGNVHVGSMRCLTREFFSFFPLVRGHVMSCDGCHGYS